MHRPRTLRGQHKRGDKKLAPWAFAGLALTVLQHMLGLVVIGKNSLYTALVYLIPTALGVLVLSTLRWGYVLRRLAVTRGMLWKVGLCAFFLVQGVLFSYCSFGLVARTTADIWNRSLRRTGSLSIERYPIDEAWMKYRSSHHIAFERNGHREQILTGYIRELSTQRWHPPFDVVLKLKAGILGSSIVEGYSLAARSQ